MFCVHPGNAAIAVTGALGNCVLLKKEKTGNIIERAEAGDRKRKKQITLNRKSTLLLVNDILLIFDSFSAATNNSSSLFSTLRSPCVLSCVK